MPLYRRLFLAAATVAVLSSANAASAQTRAITVFAAASLKTALDQANAAFTRQTGIKVVTSYAGTSALVKQIEAGAPADVFISADLRWMNYAAERKLIKPDTRINLLGNTLVLIAPKTSRLDKVAIGKGFDLAALAGSGRIAVANVDAVPAGRYAKAALQSLGAWTAAEKKLAQAQNVRAALAFVARGETPLGIVYATDAKAEPNVKVIGTFPEGSHPPIVYPAAATATTTKAEASQYIHFLRTREAKAIFERHGFSFMAQPTS
jgi:molybdate transport system substrate-binding protein